MADQSYCERDQLGRKEYVEFLKSIILNSEEYKRDDDSKSFVMALDAPWGTGKTFAIGLLKEILEKEKIQSILYSAWKNDFWNNAFEPFAQAVFWDGIFKKEPGNKPITKTLKDKIIRTLITLGKGFVKKQISEYIDAGALDELQEIIQNDFINKKPKTEFDGLISFQKAIIELKEFLNDYISKKGKLVIIIDELDRCKPLFAIETLEIVKHIFDVPNLIVLFSLDIQQLGHSVNAVYGNNMDASGYLLRFFDYISKMPNVSIEQYLFFLLKDQAYDAYYSNREFIIQTANICRRENLSLRDINIITKNYILFRNNELEKCYNSITHIFYYTFLILKYKTPAIYNCFISGNKKEYEKYGYKSENFYADYFYKSRIMFLNFDEKIKEMTILSIDDNQLAEMFNEAYSIFFVNKNNITLIQKKDKPSIQTFNQTFEIYEYTVVNTFLYIKALQEWDNIQNMTIRDFIYKRLEMYNFSFYSETNENQMINNL